MKDFINFITFDLPVSCVFGKELNFAYWNQFGSPKKAHKTKILFEMDFYRISGREGVTIFIQKKWEKFPNGGRKKHKKFPILI